MKTPECIKVLQLMDKGFSYQIALKLVLSENPNANKEKLEKELEKYI